jgi:hypothetical protein
MAMASCYLIGAYLVDMLLPDVAVQNPGRVVQFNFKGNIRGRHDDWFSGTPFVFRDEILQIKGPVVAAARVISSPESVCVGKEVYSVDFAELTLVGVNGHPLESDDSAHLRMVDRAISERAQSGGIYRVCRSDDLAHVQ